MDPATWARVQASDPRYVAPPVSAPLWHQMAFACFYDTSTERSLGFGIGPIPYSKILEWGRWKRLAGRDLDDLVFIVRRMDAKWLELEAARMKAKE
jgi:hypothetical protein